MSYTDGAATATPDDWGEGWGAPPSMAPPKTPAPKEAPAKPSTKPLPAPPPAAAASDGDWGSGWTPAPPPPPSDDSYGKAFASGAAQGVTGVAALPSAAYSGMRRYGDPIMEKIVGAISPWGTTQEPESEKVGLSAADAATKAIVGGAAQATQGTPFDITYQPKSFGGRVVQDIGAFAPLAAAGPLGPEALATRGLTQAVLPALTTEAGRSAGATVGHPELGAALGGAAAIPIGGLGRTMIPSSDVEAATRTLGTGPLPPFAGSESPTGEMIAKGLSKVPVINYPLRRAAAGAQARTAEAASDIAGQAGATTPEATGAAIGDAFTKANSGVSAAADKAYDAVTNALPAGSETLTSPLSNTQAAVDAITTRNAASGAGPGAAVGSAQGALDMSNLGYQGMRDLRTRLRQQGQGSGLTPGERAEYGQLEDAVTQDINAHLDRLDPSQNASGLMKQADQTYASDQGRIQAVGRKLGIDNASVGNEQYVNKIESLALGGQQNAQLLGQVRQTLGPSVADQTAAQIAKKWWTGSDGQFAPTQFFKKYDALQPEAKDALFGPSGSGGFRDSYDALSTLAKRDPTLSSVLGGGPHMGAGAGAAFGAAAEGAISHFASPAVAGKALLGAPALGAMSTLMSWPKVAAAAARVGRSTQALQAAQKLGISSGTQNAATVLAAEQGRLAAEINAATGQQ